MAQAPVQSDADRIYLQLVYRRLDRLLAAANSAEQRRQARRARAATTAALRQQGWRRDEIAAAAGFTVWAVSDWYTAGKDAELADVIVAPPLRRSQMRRRTRTKPKPRPATARPPRTRLGKQPHPDRLAVLDAAGHDVLLVREVAQVYDVTTHTIRSWIAAGLLPAIRIGDHGQLRIPRSALAP